MIRGRTLDDPDLRIVVASDEEDDYLVLVTTIDLDTDRKGSS